MFICENNFYIRYFFFFHVALKLGLLIRAHKYTHKQREKQIQQHIKIRWLLQYLSVFMSFPSKQIRAQTTEIPTFSLSDSLCRSLYLVSVHVNVGFFGGFFAMFFSLKNLYVYNQHWFEQNTLTALAFMRYSNALRIQKARKKQYFRCWNN